MKRYMLPFAIGVCCCIPFLAAQSREQIGEVFPLEKPYAPSKGEWIELKATQTVSRFEPPFMFTMISYMPPKYFSINVKYVSGISDKQREQMNTKIDETRKLIKSLARRVGVEGDIQIDDDVSSIDRPSEQK